MEDLIPIFATFIVFGTIVAIVYLIVRKRERMALIEKGVDASIFMQPKQLSYPTLKFGLLFVGVALGILFGSLLEAYTDMNVEAGYFGMVFFFGGIGLVISHFIEKADRTK